MELSEFGQKFTQHSGILELMDDLGRAMAAGDGTLMLGGGNPAHIPEINALWRQLFQELMDNGSELEGALANYASPQGREDFLQALADLLNQEWGWSLGPENIAVTNGSQNAYFLLLNFLAGTFPQGRKKRILFPLAPEYIGYADQALGRDAFVSHKPRIELLDAPFFKYRVDFDQLPLDDSFGAICVSRPTNPTGNVLTDGEMDQLQALASRQGIPLIVDNAYGAPFPAILFQEVKPHWSPGMVLTMSLSKLGLPGVRTGLVVADPELIKALSSANAILNLANTSLGQALTLPIIRNGEILKISRNIIQPFYAQKSRQTLAWVQEYFLDLPYRVHVCEGALFLWLWFPGLPISSQELYERLKARKVLVVSGHYFFFGLDADWKHSRECLRLTYSQDSEKVKEGIALLAEEIRKLLPLWKNREPEGSVS